MDCKEYATKYLTASEILSNCACELSHLVVLASNARGDLNIYDGCDTNGEHKLRIRPANSSNEILHFTPHIYFRRGLYIVFTQKIDSCFVQWRQRPQSEG